MRRYLIALLLPFALNAQTSVVDSLIKVQTDSIRNETCRGGVLSPSGLICSGTRLSMRSTVLRRAANRIDSLQKVRKATPVVSRIDVSFDHTTTTVWSSGHLGSFRNDNEVLCAKVEVKGATYLGAPAAMARYVSHDSITWRILPDTGAALATRCAGHGITPPTWPVTWSAYPVRALPNDTLWFVYPFAAAVVP